MHIGIMDVDNINKTVKFPNLALMKLSTYHKQLGDTVELYSITSDYDIVYCSKVFDFTIDAPHPFNANKVVYGGVGYDLENKLDHYIEHMMPDYEMFGIHDKAYGFLTRGCPKNCSFCNVTQHQGKEAVKVADLSEFWRGQKEVVLLDPNMYACSSWEDLNGQLVDSGAKVDFSQGIDIRVMTKNKINAINKLNIQMIHFAWDTKDDLARSKLVKYRDSFRFSERQLRVYVLTNYDTDHNYDLYRVNTLRQMGYDPYVMVFNKGREHVLTRRLQRWVNNKVLWRRHDSFDVFLAAEYKDH